MQMIQCEKCGRWYHLKLCVVVEDLTVNWHCEFMIMGGTIPFNSQENLALVEYILFLGQGHYLPMNFILGGHRQHKEDQTNTIGHI